jgi:2-hydroxychromene-2-carboxylate isomerase
MGDLISLAERRAAHPEPAAGPAAAGARAARVTFFFDLCSPWTYLAAERADRVFPGARWRPATGRALAGPAPGGRAGPAGRAADARAIRAAAERRAVELGMPLIWPERWPDMGAGAMRVAALAAEHGVAPAFVLAASRLAFCGGFELDDPEVLAEAAAAANLPLADAFKAATDETRDGPMVDDALRLLAAGADVLPAVRVGRLLFSGEDRLSEAAAAAQASVAQVRRPVPQAG